MPPGPKALQMPVTDDPTPAQHVTARFSPAFVLSEANNSMVNAADSQGPAVSAPEEVEQAAKAGAEDSQPQAKRRRVEAASSAAGNSTSVSDGEVTMAPSPAATMPLLRDDEVGFSQFPKRKYVVRSRGTSCFEEPDQYNR